MARIGIATVGVGVVLAAIIGGVMAITPEASSSQPVAEAEPVVAQASQVAKPVAVATRPAPAPARPASTARLVPAIDEGRRELGDSMFAVREGFEVTVHFDTEERRTRYDWKFEDVVRATLPVVFGPAARTALDSVPEGTFARGGDLLHELPKSGIALAFPDGGEVRVWPITRPGRDGPLVVAYRAAVSGN